jgi:nucleotide-binding universal stress UspA family protein
MGKFRRIVVALDTSTPHRGVANMASDLALRLKASLHGLYVEDGNLAQLAEHPCATVVGFAASRPTDGDLLARALRIQADAAEKALIEAANRLSLAFSFSATRGRIAGAISEICRPEDLVVIGMRRETIAPVIDETPRSLLLLRRGVTNLEPVHLLFDGGEASYKALELAIELATRDGGRLEVHLLAQSQAQGQKLEAEIRRVMADTAIFVTCHPCLPPALPKLRLAVEKGGVVVTARGMAAISLEEALSLLEKTRCSLGIAA